MVKKLTEVFEKLDKSKFNGKALFIDRDNINTDEIIPAKYLTFVDTAPLKPHLLEDLKMEGFNPQCINFEEYGVVITRANFGCGSSRESAVWSFEVNGIFTLIAENFARIFHENAFNRGVLAIELNSKQIDEIFKIFAKTETQVEIDLDNKKIKIKNNSQEKIYPFSLNKLQEKLIYAGGWVNLANISY